MGKIIYILSCLLMATSLLAQREITGRLIDKNSGEAMVSANVIIKNAEGKMVRFATTGLDGDFFIKLPEWREGMTINVSMVGKKRYVAPLLIDDYRLDIMLEDDTQELSEVIVKAGKIRESGDTVTYLVSGFAQKQDRTIGDVLRRMPGIDVSSNGKIQYQGVDINRFYIEGGDILGGKYAIATQGISHDDIGSVEVLENHQPMQVLSGISFSDQAAINLKLKDKSKATWLSHGHIGGGLSSQPKEALWNGEFFLMGVMSGYQTITSIKGNNNGLDLRGELFDFFAEGRNTDLGEYISVELPTMSNLGSNRTTFNRSLMLSSSHLWKKKRYEIKSQIDYYNHRETASSVLLSTYFLDSGEKVIEENRDGTGHGNRLTGKFIMEANQKNYYLNNTFQAEFDWDDLRTSMTGSLPNRQSVHTPNYYLSNRLKTIKRLKGNHLITLNSINEWESKPQRLSVNYRNGRLMAQHISNHSFYTNERASYGFYLKNILLSVEGGLEGYLRTMKSNLDGDFINAANVAGNISTNYLSLYASPKLEYTFRQLELTVQYPIHYTMYRFGGMLGNISEYFHSPFMRIRWTPIQRLSLTVSGGLSRTPMSLYNIHGEVIMSDYRSFTRGVNEFYANARQHLSGRLQYRDSPNGFFAHAMLLKSWNSTPYKLTQRFFDDYIFRAYDPTTSRSHSINASGGINKTLNFINGTIGVKGGYNRQVNNMVSENLPTRYIHFSWNLEASINGGLSNYLFASYKMSFSRSMLEVNSDLMSNLDKYVHNLGVTVYPLRSLAWETEGEYYRNEIVSGNYKGIFLLDTKLTWKFNDHFEFVASLSNLFNRKEYSYTTYSSLSSMESTRYLRGREFLLSIYLKR